MASPVPQPRTSFGEAAYHEFYRDDFEPRAHYRPLWEHIRKAGQSLLSEKRREAHWTLHTDGVTFTVYGDEDEGIERVWPLDLLPRIIPAAEWAPIEAGLKQRLRALNAFLADLYGPQRVLRDGVVPAELIYRGKDFRREIHGIEPPLGLYVHIAGIDLVRDERRPLPRARGQPAHAVGRLVHDREPHRRAAHAARVLRALPRAARRALPGAPAPGAARALAARQGRRGRRAAHARHLQLGLLRAHLPGARDGHRAGRGPRPRRRRTTSST